VNVETKNDIVSLVKSLKRVQAYLKFDEEHKPHYITEPHITIASKLVPWQYEQGWLEYSNSEFSAHFMVNKIVLLKRNDSTKKYVMAAT
ncbi:hypothetical protein ABTM49_19960, partial [Acinetobacter baumannii]